MCDVYGKVIESFYWVCKVNKQMIINGAEPDEILQSIKDLKCALRMKLSGKEAVDLASLVDKAPIAPQMVSQMIMMKPGDFFELVEEELEGKSDAQIKVIKTNIANICRSQALAHQHAADSADHLEALTDMVSIPIMLKVMSAIM